MAIATSNSTKNRCFWLVFNKIDVSADRDCKRFIGYKPEVYFFFENSLLSFVTYF